MASNVPARLEPDRQTLRQRPEDAVPSRTFPIHPPAAAHGPSKPQISTPEPAVTHAAKLASGSALCKVRTYLIPERKPSQHEDQWKSVCDALLGACICPRQCYSCIKTLRQVLHISQHHIVGSRPGCNACKRLQRKYAADPCQQCSSVLASTAALTISRSIPQEA